MALRTSLPVQPHLYLADTLGRPLDGGKVFFGEVNKDPELYPINIFYDSDLTIAAPQPVRSKGGFMNANGDMVEVYASEVNYSVKVLDSYGRQVFYAPDMSRANSDDSIIVEGGVTQKSINMGFSDIAAIKAIVGANVGMRVYSQTLASNFIFKATSTSPVNDGTVLQGIGGVWEMEDKDAYFASWFATPNVQADQALRLQAGYAYATSKDKPFIIDDIFWVDVRAQPCNLPEGDRCGILILDDSDMRFTAKGHIKALPNNYSNYHIMIACNDVANYSVYKPVLEGDRLNHTYVDGSTNEWGYGLTIYESSNGTITNPRISNTTGDCLYVGKAWGSMRTTVPKDITITDPILSKARRNGCSLTSGDNVQILRPVINKVGDSDGIVGAYPKACIDVEPENAVDAAAPRIVNCIIDSPVLTDSYAGIYIYAFRDNQEMTLHVKGITTLDGTYQTGAGFYHGGADGKGKVVIDHLYYKTEPYSAILAGWNKLSGLSLKVNKLTSDSISSLVFRSSLNGAFVGKTLGNLTIENIDIVESIQIMPPEDIAYTIDGYQILAAPKSQTGVKFYIESTSASFGGKDTHIVSNKYFIHVGFTELTKTKPNEIWQDPSVSPADTIYLSATDDYRELKIGLYDGTAAIGNGCNINGIRVNLGSGIKTAAQCKTLGGWLKFQNIAGKNTRIIDSYGVWTFS